MSKTKQVFELKKITRGKRWKTGTEPIHYDVEKEPLDFFLTWKDAAKEGKRRGCTYVNAETGVNAWLKNFENGDPTGFCIEESILTDWNEHAKSGIPPSATHRVRVKK